MTASSNLVTISQLTTDGSRPADAQIIAALFPPLPAYLRGLVQDYQPETKQQVAGIVAALVGWNSGPQRALLVGPVGSGKIAMLHGASKFAEACCIRIQITADAFASDLDRLFAQAEQHERVLVVIDHPGNFHTADSYEQIDALLARHVDRLAGRANTVVVVTTNKPARLSKDLQERFGDFQIDISPKA